MHRISVVGLGYVGLSLAVVNAKRGYGTTGVDIDEKKINRLRAGRPDFFEPGLDGMLADSIKNKTIHFTTNLGHAIRNSEITFLTVGTPLKSSGAEVDLSHIKSAAEQIALALGSKKGPHTLVVKSTVPPLTTQNHILPALGDMVRDGRVAVTVNPEFLHMGSAIQDLLEPHLIVIGSKNQQDLSVLEEYYNDFYRTLPRIIRTNIPTAEIIKYANNGFLATKVSFINSIASLCQSIPGADVKVVAQAIGMDPNIGQSFLRAGPGFGGSCLPKDLVGLIRIIEEIGQRPDLFRAVNKVNDGQFGTIMDMIQEQGNLAEGSRIAILGLAFKSGTDDVRGSVSVRVVERLLEHKLSIRVHDPMALKNFEQIFGSRVSYYESAGECLEGSDCCVILTDWGIYKKMGRRDFEQMRTCNIIDTRRTLDAGEFAGAGFRAIGLGGLAP